MLPHGARHIVATCTLVTLTLAALPTAAEPQPPPAVTTSPAKPAPTVSPNDESRAHARAVWNILSASWLCLNHQKDDTPCQGRQKRKLDPEEFYRIAGREDLLAVMKRRTKIRYGLIGAGLGALGMVIVLDATASAINPVYGCAEGPDGPGCGRFGVLANNPKGYYYAGLGFFAVGIHALIVGLALGRDPLDWGSHADVANEYNRRLERKLGLPERSAPPAHPRRASLRLVPALGPNQAGLVLEGRF